MSFRKTSVGAVAQCLRASGLLAAGVVRSGFLPDIVQPVSEVRSQAVGFFTPPRLPAT